MIPQVAGVRWRQADMVLVVASVGLVALGAALVTSATWRYYDQPSLLGNTWFLKQLAFAFVGLVAMGICAAVHPRVIRAFAYGLYAVSLMALIAVLLLGRGSAEYGAQRWIEIGGFPFQPSEPAKLALIVSLARIMGSQPVGLRMVAITAALTAAPVILIYVQPDLGTATSLGAIWFGMLLLGGVSARYALAIVALAAVAAPVGWLMLKEYMRARVLIFLNPEGDALGQGYNILQAQISIGSGGMWGKGLLEGTQTQLRYLPVSHSDFIFSVLGEELGFVGAMVLFGLIGLLLFRVLRAYDIADSRYGGLLCAGVVAMIGFQATANLAGNVGLMPVVGIPLPLVSHGGSALITQMAALGMVQGTLLRRRLYRFEA